MDKVVEPDLQTWLSQAKNSDHINIMVLLDTQIGFEETIEVLRSDLAAKGLSWDDIVQFRFLDSIGLSVSAEIVRVLETHDKIRMLVLANNEH